MTKKQFQETKQKAQLDNLKLCVEIMEKEISTLREALRNQGDSLNRLQQEKAAAELERDNALKTIGRLVVNKIVTEKV